ncbi:hypothetical protein RFI_39073 [Reticulomyxa filosa]|uniref:Uncharacterized protein n=1 Tax=Reticulomyxa filosa TaxID=46433 RepID=X6L8T8_RETFI|nr:hypothetical protein RFI_39073 [Reticulomyxa filosa]|eukprot:ETN98427.1 hypothetical protein RFI_39073 [Reticulomyxa filosa]
MNKGDHNNTNFFREIVEMRRKDGTMKKKKQKKEKDKDRIKEEESQEKEQGHHRYRFFFCVVFSRISFWTLMLLDYEKCPKIFASIALRPFNNIWMIAFDALQLLVYKVFRRIQHAVYDSQSIWRQSLQEYIALRLSIIFAELSQFYIFSQSLVLMTLALSPFLQSAAHERLLQRKCCECAYAHGQFRHCSLRYFYNNRALLAHWDI